MRIILITALLFVAACGEIPDLRPAPPPSEPTLEDPGFFDEPDDDGPPPPTQRVSAGKLGFLNAQPAEFSAIGWVVFL